MDVWSSDVVDFFAKCRNVSHNTGIIKTFGFEVVWKIFRFQTLCLCLGHLPLDQVALFFKGHFPRKRVCAKARMRAGNDFSTQTRKGSQSVTWGIHLSSEYELLEWLIMNQIHLIMNSLFTLHWACFSTPASLNRFSQQQLTQRIFQSPLETSVDFYWSRSCVWDYMPCKSSDENIRAAVTVNSTKGWPADL